jgi:hypothetical protein
MAKAIGYLCAVALVAVLGLQFLVNQEPKLKQVQQSRASVIECQIAGNSNCTP